MSARNAETPLSPWAENVYHLPGLIFHKHLIETFFLTFMVMVGVGIFAWGRLTWIAVLTILIAGFVLAKLVSRARQDILHKNQTDWVIAQKIRTAAQEILSLDHHSLDVNGANLQAYQDYTPIQVERLPDQNILGDIRGTSQGFAFLLARLSLEAELTAKGTSLPWDEGGYLVLEKAGRSLRLVWLSRQTLANILMAMEKMIIRELSNRRDLPHYFYTRGLHFGSHTDLALREVFHGQGPLVLHSYYHRLNPEEFADQIIVDLNKGTAAEISFQGEKVQAGIVLACVVNLQGKTYSLYPLNFLLTTAKLMGDATGVELLPTLEKQGPLLKRGSE